MFELTLPWPSRTLHPNSRPHWARKADAVKAARQQALLHAIEAGWRGREIPPGKLDLWLEFYPPNRRTRDDDGLLASFKSARDGLAQALGIDDSRFHSHPMLMDEVRPGGQVVVRITAQEARHAA